MECRSGSREKGVPFLPYPFPAMQVSIPQGLVSLITHYTCLHPCKLGNILSKCQLEKTDHLVSRGQGYSYIKQKAVPFSG